MSVRFDGPPRWYWPTYETRRVSLHVWRWQRHVAFGVTWETYDDWGDRLTIRLLLPFFTVAVKFH